jgi:hypothetical protein
MLQVGYSEGAMQEGHVEREIHGNREMLPNSGPVLESSQPTGKCERKAFEITLLTMKDLKGELFVLLKCLSK